ncbi:hypothetical protein [Schumannella sp. 10F1B-5-1]|uniref:hypothetical protein n=1 Tax=Schumannella sp. 10F1B-5-1 TaxID=2590780 RepID=UPI001130613D|nr:hypothetical protein [Schumannella sp. 10F1B-5-1]TPW78427.1 hypothetical protein FJ658_01070 [Schumannella sp. 10F1B-5-1]
MLARFVLVTALAATSAVVLAGCVTINVPAPNATAPSPSSSEDGASSDNSNVDDSAALSALQIGGGALYGWVETYSSEDCSYVSYMADQLEDATPLDSYRGTYETVITNMKLVGQVCAGDPRNRDAVTVAISTRNLMVSILKEQDEAYSDIGDPVPGRRAA